jgi:hypothetical protein
MPEELSSKAQLIYCHKANYTLVMEMSIGVHLKKHSKKHHKLVKIDSQQK